MGTNNTRICVGRLDGQKVDRLVRDKRKDKVQDAANDG